MTFFSLPDGYKQHAQVDGKRMCLKAKKALYGLPQSPRLWNRKFTAWLATQGFSPTKKDPCYYILREGGEEIHLICYVDDLAFAGSSTEVLEAFKGALNRQFKMKDMGQLNWFLGCEVKQDLVNGTTTLVQTKYIHDLLARFDFMRDVAPAISPSGDRPPTLHIPRESNDPNTDEQQDWWRPLYRPLIGSLLYAAVLTRPDIAAEVAVLSQFLANPTQVHWDAAVRVLAYLKHTPERGITYSRRVDLPDNFNRSISTELWSLRLVSQGGGREAAGHRARCVGAPHSHTVLGGLLFALFTYNYRRLPNVPSLASIWQQMARPRRPMRARRALHGNTRAGSALHHHTYLSIYLLRSGMGSSSDGRGHRVRQRWH